MAATYHHHHHKIIAAGLMKFEGTCTRNFSFYRHQAFDEDFSGLPVIFYCTKEAKKKFYHLFRARPLPSAHTFEKYLHPLVHFMDEHALCLKYFKKMIAIGAPVNDQIANLAITSYHDLGHTDHGFTVLGLCFKRGGIVHTVSTYNSLIEAYIEVDKTHEAETLFKKLFQNQLSCQPDIITYNAMVNGLCKVGNNFTAVALLRLMYSRLGTPKHTNILYNALIDSFCKDKMFNHASNLFFKVMMGSNKTILPDVETYNSLIYALSKLGRWAEVTSMLKHMKDQNICLDDHTFRIIIDALCKQHKVYEATDVIDLLVDSGRYLDIVIFNSLIDGYSLIGHMTQARNIFDLLDHRGVRPNYDTYNKLFFGYCNNFMVDEAIIFHMVMVNDSILSESMSMRDDIIGNYYFAWERIKTYKVYDCLRVLGNCLKKAGQYSLGITEFEKQYRNYLKGDYNNPLEYSVDFEDSLALFRFMDENKLNLNIDVYNILIDRASICLEFDTARHLFHDLIVKGLKPDIKTYTVMINFFREGGLHKEAKQLLLKWKGCSY